MARLIRSMTLTGAVLTALVGLSVVAVPTAEASSNACNLPTSAGWNDTFIQSYANCGDCQNDAYWWNVLGMSPREYCTYNPSNGLTDLHGQTSVA